MSSHHLGRGKRVQPYLVVEDDLSLDVEAGMKRRTLIARIFPNEESCLPPISALAVETHENWIEANRYLDMSLLTEMKKTLMELLA